MAKKYGVDRIYLFGSYARGDADEDSDVDFRIERGQIENLLDLAGLYLDLKNDLGQEVDIVTTDGLKRRFLDNIKADEVLIYAA